MSVLFLTCIDRSLSLFVNRDFHLGVPLKDIKEKYPNSIVANYFRESMRYQTYTNGTREFVTFFYTSDLMECVIAVSSGNDDDYNTRKCSSGDIFNFFTNLSGKADYDREVRYDQKTRTYTCDHASICFL